MNSRTTLLEGQIIELRLVSTSKTRFHEVLREHGRERNTAATTTYDKEANLTNWIVAGEIFGQSAGRVGNCTDYAFNALVVREAA